MALIISVDDFKQNIQVRGSRKEKTGKGEKQEKRSYSLASGLPTPLLLGTHFVHFNRMLIIFKPAAPFGTA